MPSAQRPAGRHPFAVAIGVIVVLILLFAVAIALINPSAIADRVKDHYLPEVSQRLGRQVQIGDVHVSVFPKVGATLKDVSIAGGPNEPPLVKAPEAVVSVKLWPLLRSRGHDIQVRGVELRDPAINLVHRPDGSWSYQDLGKSSPQPGAKQKPTPQPAAASPPQPPMEVVVSDVKVRNGTVRVIEETAHRPVTTVALSQLDVDANNVGPGRPARLSVRGALASSRQNMRLALAVNAIPRSAEALKTGAWPQVAGTFALDPIELANLENLAPAELTNMVTGGRLSVTLTFTTNRAGAYETTGDADLNQVSLRGAPASGGFHVDGSIDPRRANSLQARLTRIRLKGPGIDLGGTASFQAPAHVRFALNGSQLDVDTLVGHLPGTGTAPQSRPAQGRVVRPRGRMPPASPAASHASIADIQGTLTLGKVTSGKLHAENLKTDMRLERGVFTLTQGTAALYSGQASLSGTSVDMSAAKPVWNLRANLQGMQIGQALQDFSGKATVTGQLSGDLALVGTGDSWDEIKKDLTGAGTIAMTNGELPSANLGAQILGPLSSALKTIGMAGATGKTPGLGGATGEGATAGSSGKGTQIKDLKANFQVKDGWIQFTQPVALNTDFGTMSVGGRISLDQQLDLQGHVQVPPAILSDITAGEFHPKGPVDIPVRIGGTLEAARVEGVDWASVAKSVAVPALQQGLQKNLQNQFKGKIPGIFGGS